MKAWKFCAGAAWRLDESTRTQPQARQQAAYEQAYRRYLEHLPPR
ncbi:hypothetical protein P4114_23695 [Pseudomonas aeruginosa]|nr:hypothetical protein [Pseudomonas aeruginosa]